VLPAGLIAEAPRQAHRPKVAAECSRHAIGPAQEHRRGVVQPGAIVKEPVWCSEAQVVTLLIGGNGGITLAEQLGEGEQIKLVALQARLDEHRSRMPAWARSSGAAIPGHDGSPGEAQREHITSARTVGDDLRKRRTA
jgi:hypothetical protein